MSHENCDSTEFKTSDLALAATLVECGYPLAQLDRTDPRRVVFVFDDTIELSATVNEFHYDQLAVNPRSYFDRIKQLKTRIYAG